MGRRSALGQLSVEDLTLLLQLVAIDKLRPAAIWRSLPERIKSLFAGGDSVKATVKSHLNKLSDPTVTVTNVHDVARSLLGRLGKPCDEADHGRDRSASPPPRGSRSLVSSVHAGPDGDPYDTILRYAPVPEVRVPPTTPEARRILYGRAPHPTDASLDIIRVGIVVLRDSVVNTIMAPPPTPPTLSPSSRPLRAPLRVRRPRWRARPPRSTPPRWVAGRSSRWRAAAFTAPSTWSPACWGSRCPPP